MQRSFTAVKVFSWMFSLCSQIMLASSVVMSTLVYAADIDPNEKAAEIAQQRFRANGTGKTLDQSTFKFPDGAVGISESYGPPRRTLSGQKLFANPEEEFLAGTICGSNAIVRAVAEGSTAILSKDGYQIFTRTRFKTVDVIKADDSVRPNSTLFVTQPGGEAHLNGKKVRHEVRGGPVYAPGVEYVLVLDRAPEHAVGDYFSRGQAIPLSGEIIDPVGGRWEKFYPGGSYAELKREVVRVFELRPCK